jgi:hypothetical protein
MSRFDRHPREPQVFLQSFELSKEIFKSTSQFPKPVRYVLGNQLEKKSLDFLLLLNRLVGPSGVRFLRGDRRVTILRELSLNLDEFRILLRMARETGAYSAGQYQHLNSLTTSIGRQVGGMMRKSREEEAP